ncbi:MAG: hypothetical protein QM308_01895 [Bacillota bacterium]|nr:hypothetical protein [Bacillota bacterium]
MKSKLKPLIDSRLSMLDWTDEQSLKVVDRIRGEEKVKKKMSLAMVLALALALLAVTGLAVTLWKNYYDNMAKNEGENGYFDTWSGQRRADFVLDMAKEGAAFNSEALDRLKDAATSETEKADIATRLLMDKYDLSEDTITAISIMEKEKGPLPGWSLEDKAKYTRMLVETGTLGADEEMYWLPGEGDLTIEQAGEMAKAAIKDKYGARDRDFEAMRVIAELRSCADEQANKVWRVFYLNPDQDLYDMPVFDVKLEAGTGEIIEILAKADYEEENQQPLDEEGLKLDRRLISAFKKARPYTVEELAGLVQEFKPRLAELEAFRKDWGGYYAGYRHVLDQDIRLPEEGMVKAEDARKTAEEAVLSLPNWTRKRLNMFEPFAQVYYHSKELNKPVYLFIYTWKGANTKTEEEQDKPEIYSKMLFDEFSKDKAAPPSSVSVLIDARTGQTIGGVRIEELSDDRPSGMMELTQIK